MKVQIIMKNINEKIIDIELQDEGYVDLGLPSGKLWSSCNLGASKPYESGNYYAWGETEPKNDYSLENYKWCNGSENTMFKYCTNSSFGTVDNKTVLEPEDDAIYVATKGEAHMPTKDDIIELYKNTNHTWCTCAVGLREGHETHTVNGELFTSKTDSNKKIFIPAAGYQNGINICGIGVEFNIWCSSLIENYSNNAISLFSYSGLVHEYNIDRCQGFSVRGVKDKL